MKWTCSKNSRFIKSKQVMLWKSTSRVHWPEPQAHLRVIKDLLWKGPKVPPPQMNLHKGPKLPLSKVINTTPSSAHHALSPLWTCKSFFA